MGTATATLEDMPSVSDHPITGAKAFVIKIKTDGLAEGEFLGYASVFGIKDSYGDIVVKGAFENTLAEWERKGIPIPLLWGHNTADPDFNVGYVTAEQDDRGLKVHGYLDMESPKAAQTYRLLKSGRVNQMSFAYGIVDGAYVQPEGEDKSWRDAYYELREVDLYEVSIVPIAANQDAEILAVKSAVGALQVKAGKVLSAKNDSMLRGVLTQAEGIVAALKSVLPEEDDSVDEQDQDKTSGEEPPTGTEKSSDPATPSPSVSLALMEIDTYSHEEI